jgi:phosphoribosylformylglycinamidine synthase
MVNKKGFKIKCSNSLRKDAFLFGESPTRVIVSVKPSLKNEFETYMNLQTTNYLLLGEVTDNNILIDDINFGLTSDFSEIYNNSLSKKLN